MSSEFEKALEEALNSVTLTEVERDGTLLILNDYTNKVGTKHTTKMYEYDAKFYYIRYVNNECVVFRELAPKE